MDEKRIEALARAGHEATRAQETWYGRPCPSWEDAEPSYREGRMDLVRRSLGLEQPPTGYTGPAYGPELLKADSGYGPAFGLAMEALLGHIVGWDRPKTPDPGGIRGLEGVEGLDHRGPGSMIWASLLAWMQERCPNFDVTFVFYSTPLLHERDRVSWPVFLLRADYVEYAVLYDPRPDHMPWNVGIKEEMPVRWPLPWGIDAAHATLEDAVADVQGRQRALREVVPRDLRRTARVPSTDF